MVSRIIFYIFGLMLAIILAKPQRDTSYEDDFKALFNRNRKQQEKKDDSVRVVQGFKENAVEKLILSPEDVITPYNTIASLQMYYSFPIPIWRASANLFTDKTEKCGNQNGFVSFEQWTANYVKISINASGISPGKHGLHIHTYGDISEGCKSTGFQLPGNFLGNIEVKPDGSISTSFLSTFITLFGFNGIIGRSIVIHEKPIDLNASLNAEVFSIPLHQRVNNINPQQNEKYTKETAIACGVISITNNVMRNIHSLSEGLP